MKLFLNVLSEYIILYTYINKYIKTFAISPE